MTRSSPPRWIPAWLRRARRLAIDPDARADALHEWRRRRGGEPLLPHPVGRVVFVCHGNICRSPFAEGLLARERSDLRVLSAGFAAQPGKPAEPAAVRAASRFGVGLESHGARRLSAEDVAWGDLILAMQGHHVTRILAERPEAAGKLVLLGDFLQAPPFAIEDPWGHADEIFDATFEQIARAVRQMAARLDTR